MFVFWLKFNWNLLARVQSIISQHWCSLYAEQATNHYLNQWWSSLLTYIYVINIYIYASLGELNLTSEMDAPYSDLSKI